MFGFARRKLAVGARNPDRSSVIAYTDANRALDFPTTHHPELNQAESGRVNRPISARGIYRHLMNPVVYPEGYNGFTGMFHARAARVVTVVTKPGYDGIMPIREQGSLTKPLPYK
jgi:hypothetical protein